MITWGKEYWSYFLIIVSTGFLVPEVFALITNVRNTLSDYARFELGADPNQVFTHHNAAWALSLVVYIVVSAELVRHIWFGKWIV